METLGDCIEQHGALEPVDAVGWTLRLCLALEQLHARGGSHGRLSSSAIYVERPAAGSIGWLLPPNRCEPNPPFHCPERAAGGSVSQSDDTWAITVLLYHTLTGRLPFKGRDEAEIRTRIRAAAPAPLAVFDIDEDQLQGIIHHALHRDRPQRTLAVMPLRAELEEWLRARGIEGFKPLDSPPEGADVPALMPSMVPPPREPLRKPVQKLPPPGVRPASDSNPDEFEQLLARAEELAKAAPDRDADTRADGAVVDVDAGGVLDVDVSDADASSQSASDVGSEVAAVAVPSAPPAADDESFSLGLASAARLMGALESDRPPAGGKREPSARPPASARPLPKPSTPPKKASAPPPKKASAPPPKKASAPPPMPSSAPDEPAKSVKLDEADSKRAAPTTSKPLRTVPVVPSAKKKRKRSKAWFFLLLLLIIFGAAAGLLWHRGQLIPLIERVTGRTSAPPSDLPPSVPTATPADGPLPLSATASPPVIGEATATPTAASTPAATAAPSAKAGGAGADANACLHGLFPDDTFEDPADPDLTFVCEATDPREASGEVRSAVVKGRGRRSEVTVAMKEWSMLGWYEMAALAAMRGKCCPNAPKLKLPPSPEPCASIEDNLNAISAAAALGASLEAMENGVADYKTTLFCLLKIGAMRSYGRHPTPRGGERTTLTKTLQRISKR